MSAALELLHTLARVPREQQAAVAARGVQEGRWTADQVSAFFEIPDRRRVVRERPARAPAITRRMRLSRRRCSFSRYVRRFSIDVLIHPGLSTGAITTLVYLISRCGRNKQLRTCTSWLAADLGVSPRTIQNHYRQLEQAGFLIRSSPDRLGRTTIYLTDRVEVRPVQNSGAEPVAEHEEGAKISSATKETDSKERERTSSHRKSPDRDASGLMIVGRTDMNRTPVRTRLEADVCRFAGKGHPPGFSSARGSADGIPARTDKPDRFGVRSGLIAKVG